LSLDSGSSGVSPELGVPFLDSGSIAPGEHRTECRRCARVSRLGGATHPQVTGSSHGSGKYGTSDSHAPDSTMISRSGRSIRPPSPRSPLASARALTYEMTWEVTRQIMVA